MVGPDPNLRSFHNTANRTIPTDLERLSNFPQPIPTRGGDIPEIMTVRELRREASAKNADDRFSNLSEWALLQGTRLSNH